MIKTIPSLSFSDAIKTSLDKVLQFQGRSRRSEFWWTQLVVFLVSFLLTPMIGSLLNLLTIPLTFRRLHDTGRSGWWWGIGAILKLLFVMFLIGDIVTIVKDAVNAGDLMNADDYSGLGVESIFALCLKYGILYLKYIILTVAIGFCEILLLVLCCLDSEHTENDYGASPKYVEEIAPDVHSDSDSAL